MTDLKLGDQYCGECGFVLFLRVWQVVQSYVLQLGLTKLFHKFLAFFPAKFLPELIHSHDNSLLAVRHVFELGQHG